jgi:hypothetical protein
MHPDQESQAAAPNPKPDTGGRHHAKDGADLHPLIDLDRDPTPGVADHAAPEDE